ncbi:MAG: SCO family protein [Candidatus Eisenbacteria bacterium]|nr:SCO family protein [Candidatus Eisenbacteria bacterium]MCC7143529.1 SCO family protein [Candidatus Eisenbacteria bacterium]
MRHRAWSLLALACLCLVVSACSSGGSSHRFPPGGELGLKTTAGEPFRFEEHRDEVKLLYFGFTRCPSACPTALGRAESIAHLLEADSLDQKLLFLFVSIDPERDSPARLEEYLSFFGVRGIGLTGAEFSIRRAAKRYHVTYEKTLADAQNGYFFDHTTSFFLIDRAGKLRRVIPPDEPIANVAQWVRELLSERPPASPA